MAMGVWGLRPHQSAERVLWIELLVSQQCWDGGDSASKVDDLRLPCLFVRLLESWSCRSAARSAGRRRAVSAMTFMTFGDCHGKQQVGTLMTFGMTFNDICGILAVS